MGASAILRDIFQARVKQWGQDSDGFTFERPGERLDVFVYRPTADLTKTTLATIGMAARPMKDGSRTELHIARNGGLTRDEEHAIAIQLANLAATPFAQNTTFDWGHMIGLGRPFPSFNGCDAVIFSGPFRNGGWDYIDTAEGKVKILNVVPITSAERAQARTMNPMAFMSQLMQTRDIFEGV